MGCVQRWNIISMLAVGENVKYTYNFIGLNNIFEYFVHFGTYIIGPQSDLKSKCTKNIVYVGRHNDNSFIAHQFFVNANIYDAVYVLISSLIVLKSGRKNNNKTTY